MAGLQNPQDVFTSKEKQLKVFRFKHLLKASNVRH
jgi:hypothetical protein